MKNPRQVAYLNGQKRYFTGKPCKFGHIAERFVCDGVCVECKREKDEERAALSRCRIVPGVDYNHRVFVLGVPPCSQPSL